MFNWTRDSTLLLINAYMDHEDLFTNPNYRKNQYGRRCGAVDAKYPLIKREDCENRWKVLLRNYRCVIDNNNETGKIVQLLSGYSKN